MVCQRGVDWVEAAGVVVAGVEATGVVVPELEAEVGVEGMGMGNEVRVQNA